MTGSRDVTSLGGAAFGLLLLVTSALCVETSKAALLTSSPTRRRADHPLSSSGNSDDVNDRNSAEEPVPETASTRQTALLQRTADATTSTLIPHRSWTRRHHQVDQHRLRRPRRSSSNQLDDDDDDNDFSFEEKFPSADWTATTEEETGPEENAAVVHGVDPRAKREYFVGNRRPTASGRQAARRRAYYVILNRILNEVASNGPAKIKTHDQWNDASNPWTKGENEGQPRRIGGSKHAALPFSLADGQKIGLPIAGEIPTASAISHEEKRYRWEDQNADVLEVADSIRKPSQIRSSDMTKPSEKGMMQSGGASGRDEPMRHRWSTYFIGR